MARIQAKNINFTYPHAPSPLFENVSFTLDSDWKLGLIGRNGRGKTTLLKILLAELEFSGEIISNEVFKYFPYAIEETNETTLEVIKAYEPLAKIWQIEKELSLLQVDINVLYQPYQTLSMGERTKLELAMLFSTPHFFLLIDEPTNHLDKQGRIDVAAYLKRKNGFILASHDRTLLDDVCDHILFIGKDSITVTKGTYSMWKENFDRQNLMEERQHAKLEKDITRLTSSFYETKAWSHAAEKSKYRQKGGEKVPDRGYIGRKSASMMQAAKVLEHRQENMIQDKQKLLKNIETVDPLIFQTMDHYADPYIAMTNFSIYYEEGNLLFDPIFETLEKGDRLFIEGANGSGKTSIINLIMGGNISYVGSFFMDSSLIISYLPQNTHNITGSIELFISDTHVDKTLFLTLLRKMGFERELFNKPLETYSEGQKKKVLIAKSLAEKAHLYIWDEPLNYLDIETRKQIETAILHSEPTLLIIEHDTTFQKNIETKKISLIKKETK